MLERPVEKQATCRPPPMSSWVRFPCCVSIHKYLLSLFFCSLRLPVYSIHWSSHICFIFFGNAVYAGIAVPIGLLLFTYWFLKKILYIVHQAEVSPLRVSCHIFAAFSLIHVCGVRTEKYRELWCSDWVNFIESWNRE